MLHLLQVLDFRLPGTTDLFDPSTITIFLFSMTFAPKMRYLLSYHTTLLKTLSCYQTGPVN